MTIALNKKLTIVLVLFLTACGELRQNQYFAPVEQPFQDFSITLNQDLVSTQSDISALVSQDFMILNQAKENKNIIAQINLTEASLYINCGMMNNEIYVDYIDRIFESSLKAKLLIEFEEINESTTNIQLDISYTFISLESGTTWELTTNQPASIWVATPAEGAVPQRECLSRHTLEESLMNTISDL